MKVSRQIYEGLIAQNDQLAERLQGQQARSLENSRKYYALLFAAERLLKRFNSEPTLWDVPSVVAAMDSIEPGSQGIASESTDALPVRFGMDTNGFYTSHSLNTLETFGALPCRTVASPVWDAPPTAASSADLTRPERAAGGIGDGTPLPSTVPACNAFSRNSRAPLTHETSINSAV